MRLEVCFMSLAARMALFREQLRESRCLAPSGGPAYLLTSPQPLTSEVVRPRPRVWTQGGRDSDLAKAHEQSLRNGS